jgi:hypothetical protein
VLLKDEVNSEIVPYVVKSLSVPPVLLILSDSESNKIQYSFNLERLKKLLRIENNIILRKGNTILKVADRHRWDTVKEYLDRIFTVSFYRSVSLVLLL